MCAAILPTSRTGFYYEDTGEKWFDFNAICLPFEPEMWLVPLAGHTRGLCGVAVKIPRQGSPFGDFAGQATDGWLFQASDAAALFNEEAPDWLIRLALGPHQPRIRQFVANHPEVRVVTGHMWLDWFEENMQ